MAVCSCSAGVMSHCRTPISRTCSFVTAEMLKLANTDLPRRTTLTGHHSCRSCRQYIKPTLAPPVDSLFYHHAVQSANSPQRRDCCCYEQRLPWWWTEEAAPWISQQLGLSVFHIAGVVLGIALYWCWQCLLTVGGNLLLYIVTTLDVTTVAWCCRQTENVLHPAKCSPTALANIRVIVDSKCLHYLISRMKFQQSVCWRLVSRQAQGSVDR